MPNDTVSQRAEVINGRAVYFWSRFNPEVRAAIKRVPNGRFGPVPSYSGNEYQVVIREGATVYECADFKPVTEKTHDECVAAVIMGRCGLLKTSTWPFYGRGITDAGPSPDEWLWDSTKPVANKEDNGVIRPFLMPTDLGLIRAAAQSATDEALSARLHDLALRMAANYDYNIEKAMTARESDAQQD
jgi:hypothetical protein